jgi:hypothetical protein
VIDPDGIRNPEVHSIPEVTPVLRVRYWPVVPEEATFNSEDVMDEFIIWFAPTELSAIFERVTALFAMPDSTICAETAIH